MNWSQFVEAIPAAASSPFALIAYGLAIAAFIVISLSVTRQQNILKKIEKIPADKRETALRTAMGPTLKKGMSADEWIRARIHLYLFVGFVIICVIGLIIVLDASIRARAEKEPPIGEWKGNEPPPGSIVQLYPGTEIVSAVHTIDFSEWTAPNGVDKTNCCKITWNTDMVVRRVRKDAFFFAKRVATTGGEPVFTSSTHPSLSYRKVAIDVTRGPVMAKYDVLVNISQNKLNEEFPLHMRTVRYGSFADNRHEDLYLDIFQPSRSETVILKFDKNKIGKNFRFVQYPNIDGASERPYTPNPEDIDQSVPGVLKWTVKYPILGNSYKVEWDW